MNPNFATASQLSEPVMMALVTGIVAAVAAVWRALIVLYRKGEALQRQMDEIESDILDCEIPNCGVRNLRRLRRERREKSSAPAASSSLLTALFQTCPKPQPKA